MRRLSLNTPVSPSGERWLWAIYLKIAGRPLRPSKFWIGSRRTKDGQDSGDTPA